jgi:hypothetical protein
MKAERKKHFWFLLKFLVKENIRVKMRTLQL